MGRKRCVAAVLGMILATPPLALAETPREEYQRLFDEASRDRDAKTSAPKFLAFAEKHSKAEAAGDALLWIVRYAGYTPEADMAVELILKQHHKSPAITKGASALVYALPFPAVEKMYRGMVEKAEGDAAKAEATFNLAKHLAAKVDSTKLLRSVDEAQFAKLAETYGKDILTKVRDIDTDAVAKETEKLLQSVADNLAASKESIADAKDRLFVLQRLSVGKVAPDIEDEDTDGKKFKLSDYRGKVVLLDFWGHWCVHCMRMVPHEKEMVKKYQDRPFAIVGVNSDDDKELIKKENEKHGITWRSFWNGADGAEGPIAKAWRVEGWPTLYLIDDKGVIRQKWTGNPGDKVIDAAVEELVKEAEKK